MNRAAKLSACRLYRYALWRTWDETRPYTLFIGLNPSTADEIEDDPTSRRCVTFAKDWGYGGLCMANLFAFRATVPTAMMACEDPIGPRNDMWLKRLAAGAGVIIAAWGNLGSYRERSAQVTTMLPNMNCLKLNKSGEPAHPLYQPKTATPVPFLFQ